MLVTRRVVCVPIALTGTSHPSTRHRQMISFQRISRFHP